MHILKGKLRAPQRTMVTNPIYDGPMYESIHPQFRIVNRQSETTTATGESDSKEGGESRESEHDTELSLPDDVAGSDQELSPRYVRNTKTCLKADKDPQLMQASLTLSPAPSLPTPALPQSHHRERNVLGLTLDLSENTNGVGVARGLDISDINGRQTRRRAATTSNSRPHLLSFLSSTSSTPNNDDNYTVMSPMTHVPVVTPDGTSFLREEKRAFRDRCTTLI